MSWYSALKIEQAFIDAGFPENIFQSVIGDYRAGEALDHSQKSMLFQLPEVSTLEGEWQNLLRRN